MSKRIEGPRRAAVLGSPIDHSLSPVLHRAAYQSLKLEGWTYDAIEVREGELAAFLKTLDTRSWAGLSLTMPLKREALGLVRMRSATAVEAGGANTLIPVGKGFSAENTDVPGMVAALDEASVPAGSSATVIGAGATAVSTVVALLRRGVTDLTITARRPAAADEVRARLDPSIRSRTLPWGDPRALEAPLVVSTVPKGAADLYGPHVPAGPGALFDVVYDPWPTPLAAAWSEAGGTVLGGLDLLVHQAVLQVELMTGRRPSVRTLRRAGLAALQER